MLRSDADASHREAWVVTVAALVLRDADLRRLLRKRAGIAEGQGGA
jgi:hypothetical protein